MGKLDGKIAIVTRAASLKGFGFATAQLFAQEDAKLLLTDTKAAVLDAAAKGIRINSVHPGHLDTDMLADEREVAPEMITAIESNVPMKHLGTAIDIAAMHLFLASADSRYISGTEFVVDGALMAK